MEDLQRDFWIRETGTGQRVAQLHERYMMMMMMMIIYLFFSTTLFFGAIVPIPVNSFRMFTIIRTTHFNFKQHWL